MCEIYFRVFSNAFHYGEKTFSQMTGGKFPNAETAAGNYVKSAVNALAVAIPCHIAAIDEYLAAIGIADCKTFRYSENNRQAVLIVMPETRENLHNRVKADITGIQPTFQI